MTTRQERILSCIDPSTQIGVEIGALANPIVTRQMGQIRYVDHTSTEGLREKYAHDPSVDINKIVDVNYVWGAQSLSELVGNEAPFDYVVASHVVEHVPDFIGWLKEIRAILKPGGILSLAIPDKRFCFDYRRQLTKPADVIDAYLRKARKPSPRQIFDHFSSAVSWRGNIAWSGNVEEDKLVPLYSEAQAWEIVNGAFTNDTYCDSHCWVFTPDSFFELLRTLINLRLLDFRAIDFCDTQGHEFFVSLQALDPGCSNDYQHLQLESLPIIQQIEGLPAIQEDSSSEEAIQQPEFQQNSVEQHSVEMDQLKHQLEQAKQQLQKSQLRCKRLRNRVQRLQVQKENLKIQRDFYRHELNAVQGSKFWKIRMQWSKLKHFGTALLGKAKLS